MAAQPETIIDRATAPHGMQAEADARPSALVLPLNVLDANGHRLIDEAAGSRLGPARGLMLGLAVGALLWAGLALLAWKILGH